MKTYIVDVVYTLPTGVFEQSISEVTSLTYSDGQSDKTVSVEEYVSKSIGVRYFKKLHSTNGIYDISLPGHVLSINFR